MFNFYTYIVGTIRLSLQYITGISINIWSGIFAQMIRKIAW